MEVNWRGIKAFTFKVRDYSFKLGKVMSVDNEIKWFSESEFIQCGKNPGIQEA